MTATAMLDAEVAAMSRPVVLANRVMCWRSTSSIPAFWVMPAKAKAQRAMRVTSIMFSIPPLVRRVSTRAIPVLGRVPVNHGVHGIHQAYSLIDHGQDHGHHR